jgi:hypothetical protein
MIRNVEDDFTEEHKRVVYLSCRIVFAEYSVQSFKEHVADYGTKDLVDFVRF